MEGTKEKYSKMKIEGNASLLNFYGLHLLVAFTLF
jgi:hypothetical protein